MSSLVPPPPKHDTPPLTKADVPRYVNAILGMAAVTQSMGVDDLLRFGIETSYAALERLVWALKLSASRSGCVARLPAQWHTFTPYRPRRQADGGSRGRIAVYARRVPARTKRRTRCRATRRLG